MKGKKLLLKFLLTYMLLAIVVLSVMLTTFRAIINVQVENIHQEQSNKMLLITAELEDRFHQYNEIATLIYHDYKTSASWIQMSAYNAIEALEELRKYQSKCIDTDELFLYSFGDVIFSSRGFSDTTTFSQRVHSMTEESQQNFLDCLHGCTSSLCVFYDQLNQTLRPKIFYFCTIPVNDPHPSSAVGFVLDASNYAELMKNALGGNGGYMCLRLADGSIASEYGNKMLLEHADRALADASTSAASFQFDGASYACQRTQLQNMGLEFFMITDAQQMLEPVTKLWQTVLCVIAAMLIVSIVLSFLFSHYNYRPIRQLRTAIVSLSDETDDLDAVQKVIRLTMNENESLHRRVAESHALMEEKAVRMMFEGNSRDEIAARKIIRIIGRELPIGNVYTAAVVQASEEVLPLLIGSTFDTIHFSLQINGQAAICVILDSSEDDPSSLIDQCAALRSLLDIDAQNARIGVGQTYDQPGFIHRSMNEAIAALNQSACGETAFFSQMAQMKQTKSKISEQLRTAFASAVKRRNTDAMLQCMSLLLETLKSEAFSPEMCNFWLYDIVHIVLDSLIEMGADQQFLHLLVAIDTSSLEKFEDGLQTLLLAIGQSRSTSDFRANRFSKIEAYLQENFRDPNLTVEQVAEHFGLTRSYLSHMFREETGCTYIDYVSNLRIEEAKRLMCCTSDSIQIILQSIGYHDASSFHRKFKKLTGMTPTNYRSQIQPSTSSNEPFSSSDPPHG